MDFRLVGRVSLSLFACISRIGNERWEEYIEDTSDGSQRLDHYTDAMRLCVMIIREKHALGNKVMGTQYNTIPRAEQKKVTSDPQKFYREAGKRLL